MVKGWRSGLLERNIKCSHLRNRFSAKRNNVYADISERSEFSTESCRK